MEETVTCQDRSAHSPDIASQACPDRLPHSPEILLTPQEAFLAMSEFARHFASHGRFDLVEMLSDIAIEPDGGPRDPAAWGGAIGSNASL